MTKKITLSFLILLFTTLAIHAQVITVQPPFPTASDSVTIIFDATQGNAGLKDFTGDVYAHTGVITDKSKDGHEWRHVNARGAITPRPAK